MDTNSIKSSDECYDKLQPPGRMEKCILLLLLSKQVRTFLVSTVDVQTQGTVA